MRHLLFTDPQDAYSVAVLVKSTSFNHLALNIHYAQPLKELGIPRENLIGFTLEYNENGKAPAGFIKEYLAELLPELHGLGVQYLYVTDAAYFKVLTRQARAEIHMGYVLPCTIKGFEHMQVVLGINHSALIFNPDLQAKLDKSLATLHSHVMGNYQAPGIDIIHSSWYPKGDTEIAQALDADAVRVAALLAKREIARSALFLQGGKRLVSRHFHQGFRMKEVSHAEG